jgi:hypothetical protein
VGKALATDFINVLRPAQDKVSLLHPSRRATILSWRNLKSLHLLREEKIGAPRYVEF